MNYKDKLKTHLRIKETIIYLCGAAVIVSVILLLVFSNQDKYEYLKPLAIVSVVSLIVIRPLSKNAKKDKEQLKNYEDKEKAEKKARFGTKNPANKFNIGINRTNALLGGSTINEQEDKKEEDPIGRFK